MVYSEDQGTPRHSGIFPPSYNSHFTSWYGPAVGKQELVVFGFCGQVASVTFSVAVRKCHDQVDLQKEVFIWAYSPEG